MEETNAANKIAGCFLFDGPWTKAKQLPVAGHERHVTPAFESVERLAGPEKVHDFRVRAELQIRFEVVSAPLAHDETIGFELDVVHVVY